MRLGLCAAFRGDRPVGMTATLRSAYDFAQPDHTFDELIAGGFFTSHDPRSGFEVRGILRGYLHDAKLGDGPALLVWTNTAYREV